MRRYPCHPSDPRSRRLFASFVVSVFCSFAPEQAHIPISTRVRRALLHPNDRPGRCIPHPSAKLHRLSSSAERDSMPIRLKPIKDQVIVITGASSGIGLATAQEAARRGARVVLASRDEADIKQAADQIAAEGGQATPMVADVGDQLSMEKLAEQAIVAYDRIDTWVNNAGVSIYGLLEEVPLEDAHRLFETNYWGVVHGSLAALPHLKLNGGALINVGSELSETAMPL